MEVWIYEVEQFFFLTNWTQTPYKCMDLPLKSHPPLRKASYTASIQGGGE